MKKITLLTLASIIHLMLTTIWTVIYFPEMNDGKGWGLLWMTGLYFIGIAGLAVSFITGLICEKFITGQSRRIQNTIEAAILTGFILFVALKF